MMKANNDNEPNPWSSIGLQAAMIVNKLRCQSQLMDSDKKQDEERGAQSDAGHDDKADTANNREYVETRLREIAAWERKVHGGKKF